MHKCRISLVRLNNLFNFVMTSVSQLSIVQIVIKCKSMCFFSFLFAFNHMYLLFKNAKCLRTFFFFNHLSEFRRKQVSVVISSQHGSFLWLSYLQREKKRKQKTQHFPTDGARLSAESSQPL